MGLDGLQVKLTLQEAEAFQKVVKDLVTKRKKVEAEKAKQQRIEEDEKAKKKMRRSWDRMKSTTTTSSRTSCKTPHRFSAPVRVRPCLTFLSLSVLGTDRARPSLFVAVLSCF